MLLRNDLLEFSEPRRRIVRILWIDVARSFAYVFDVASEGAEVELHRVTVLESEMARGRVRRLEADPYLVAANPEALPPKHIELRERAWNVLSDLVLQEPDIYEPRRRGQLVQEATRRHGVSHPTIYRYLRRYWQRGQTPNALLPDYANSGGRGKTRTSTPGVKRGRPRKDGAETGVNVDDSMRVMFRLAAARHAASHTHFVRRTAYDEMVRDFLCQRTTDAYSRRVRRTPASGPMPSFGQFNYWLDQDHLINAPELPLPLADSAHIAQQGQPGAAFRLDVLPFGLQLLHGKDRAQLVGTPVLYVMTDVFSGMVTGFYASTEAVEWNQAVMALASCAAEKSRLARRHGRLLPPQAWPSCHLPERLLLPPDIMKRAHAAAAQLDLSRIAAIGHSAGGHLAQWAAARHKLPQWSAAWTADPLSLPTVISLGGLADLRNEAGLICTSCERTTPQLAGEPTPERPDVFLDTSPAEMLPSGVRTLLIHGELDVISPPATGERYAARARAAGDEAEVIVLPGGSHYDEVSADSPCWAIVRREILKALGISAR